MRSWLSHVFRLSLPFIVELLAPEVLHVEYVAAQLVVGVRFPWDVRWVCSAGGWKEITCAERGLRVTLCAVLFVGFLHVAYYGMVGVIVENGPSLKTQRPEVVNNWS